MGIWLATNSNYGLLTLVHLMSAVLRLTFLYGRTLALSGLSYHPARGAH